MRRIAQIVLVAALLTLAGCGGEAEEGSAEAWAGDVCASLNGWFTDVDEAVEGLTDEGLQLEKADIEDAVGAVEDATAELGDELDQLDRPDVESGEEAQAVVSELRDALREDVETIEGALDGGSQPLEAVSTVAAALSAAAEVLQESYDALVELDAGGELESAFEDSDDCNALRDQLQDLRG
jgi:hypothetical protein